MLVRMVFVTLALGCYDFNLCCNLDFCFFYIKKYKNKELTKRLKNEVLLPAAGVGGGDGGFGTVWEV